ncbi:MAG: L-rhamnose mutarotase [Actinobacteria bacterium]|nr:L-rhamnose mutarotase [Actinomycetota bacterium]
MSQKRYCIVLEIKEEFVDKYKNIHINAWPELLRAEQECGITNELIWIYKNLAIVYIECNDLKETFKKIALNEVEMKWDKTVSPWFKNVEILEDSNKIPVLEKIFDLNQQLEGSFDQY